MDYYIDGYNFLFRIGLIGPALEKQRQKLINILDAKMESIRGNITLVFDSASTIQNFPQMAFFKHLTVAYPPMGLSADSYIVELIEQSKNPKRITLVTNDRALARRCRHLHREHMTIDQFIAFLVKNNQKKQEKKLQHRESAREIERLKKIFEEELEKG